MNTSCPRCGASDLAGGLALCPRCFLAADDADEPVPAAPVGLVLDREIGRGGMGRVFSARHVRLDRTVAVKFLPPDLALDPSFEARFEREARALAKLVHPHIVTVHDFGVNLDGEPYLVMELVSGGTLRERIPLPLPDALALLGQICDGLGHAHDCGLVHRDVKPENVLIDKAGRVRLVDFGIARLVAPNGASDVVTQPLWVLGTPGYLAPEALRGAPPDPRLDVYAVGVLIHVLLTGHPPRSADLSALPHAVRSIVAKATALDPAARHADAGELGKALGALDPMGREDVELPPDEVSWMRAVSLALTGATALSLYAFLTSVSPRIVRTDEALPLVTFGARALADGRLATRARFETMPVLAAAAGWSVALATYGLLRRHWRASGLQLVEPDRRLRGTRSLLVLAAVINGLFVARLVLDSVGAMAISSYAPVIGGVIEMAMLYVFWMTVLDALRISRPLRREPWLWLGLAWALVPPVLAFVDMLRGHDP